jgi:acyl carrier protein
MGVEERMRNIIVRQLHPHEDQLTRQARFIEDLGADLQDIIELVTQIEQEFNIKIPYEEAKKITTVGEAIEFVEAHDPR